MEDFFHDLNAIFVTKLDLMNMGITCSPGMTIFSVLRAVMFTCLTLLIQNDPIRFENNRAPYCNGPLPRLYAKKNCKKFTQTEGWKTIT